MMACSLWGSNDGDHFTLISDVTATTGGLNPTYTFTGTDQPTTIYTGGSDIAGGIVNAYTRDYNLATAYRYFGIRATTLRQQNRFLNGDLGNVQDADPEVDALATILPTGGPGLSLVKSAYWPGQPNELKPFEPVTYSFVVTNTGSVTLNNIVVTDDNFTPGDPSDDYVVGTIATLAPGASNTLTPLTVTVYPPIKLCAPDPDGGPEIDPAGMLNVQDMGDGTLCVKYTQSQAVNDNRYGTGATAATGWPSGHTFNALVGSDKCEFRFQNTDGTTALDIYSDCITQAASVTFSGGTINYPTGYGTLGPNGGDGSLVSGSLSNVVSVHTSISDNLILSQFQPAGYRTNSPPETAPNSGISTPLGWDYDNSYTVCVKKSMFKGGVFGSVSIPDQHNSPNKISNVHGLVPEPCDANVTNTATASVVVNGSTLTATDSVTIFMTTSSGGGGGGPSDVTAAAPKLDKNKMIIALKNNGSGPCTIEQLKLDWPAADKKLKTIKNGGATLFGTASAPTTLTVSVWKGTVAQRTIPAGGTLTLTFEFETNVNKSAALYDLFIDCGGGFGVDLIP